MAASVNGLLGATFVAPLGAPPPPASTAGFTLAQITGVWVTGAGAPVAATAGLTLNQSMGVWVSGSIQEAVSTVAGGGIRTLHEANDIRWIAREEEELIVLTTLVLGVLHEAL